MGVQLRVVRVDELPSTTTSYGRSLEGIIPRVGLREGDSDDAALLRLLRHLSRAPGVEDRLDDQ